MKLFDRDPGGENKTGSGRTGSYNHVTMPSHNYAVITETEEEEEEDGANGGVDMAAPRGTDKNAGHAPLHAGEKGAGTTHAAADGRGRGGGKGGLAVCVQVEIDQRDGEGRTEGYGFSSESCCERVLLVAFR